MRRQFRLFRSGCALPLQCGLHSGPFRHGRLARKVPYTCIARTPAIRDEERDPGKGVGYPGLERFGYKVERPKMLPGVERGKPEDYAKSKLAQNKVPGS